MKALISLAARQESIITRKTGVYKNAKKKGLENKI